MKPPKIAGKLVYFFGYPLFRILIRGTTRAYIAICYENEILLTKNWLGSQKKWRLPGGGVHKNEDLVIAIQRELKEEVGITVEPKDLKQLTTESVAAQFKYEFYIFTYFPDKKPITVPDEREILVTEWVTKDTLKDHYLSEESTVALRLLGWL